jgi:hypothetical protein
MKRLIIFCTAMCLLSSCEFFKSDNENKVKISDQLEVYYSGEATKEEAKALGDFLEENEMVNTEENTTVKLNKEDEEYEVRLAYDEEKYEENKEGYLFTFSKYPSQISKNVFDGETTSLILTDDKFEDVEVVQPMKKARINQKSNVFYKGNISEGEARKLGEYLLQIKYFNDESVKDVILSQNRGEYLVRFIIDRNRYKENKEAAYKDFQVYQHIISLYAFGGQKANIILTDTKFKDIDKIKELTSKEKADINNLMDQIQNPELYQNDSTEHFDPSEIQPQDSVTSQQ